MHACEARFDMKNELTILIKTRLSVVKKRHCMLNVVMHGRR
jgi:hypothetical protein